MRAHPKVSIPTLKPSSTQTPSSSARHTTLILQQNRNTTVKIERRAAKSHAKPIDTTKLTTGHFTAFQREEIQLYPPEHRYRLDQASCSVVSDSLLPHESQHARPPCPSPTPGVHSNSRPWSQWCHPAISSSVVPFPPTFNLSQHQDLFKWVSSLHQVAKVLEIQLQHQSFQWIFGTDFL